MTIRTKTSRRDNESQLRKIMDFAQVLLSYHADDSLMHFQFVEKYTRLLCNKYNDLFPERAIPKADLTYIYEGARLHDIGKIAVPDEVLRKKGKVTADEYDELKRHTIVGAQIMDRMIEIYKLGESSRIMRDICLYHHERYDGKGYPKGLKGDEIPLGAQIISLAEVYDGLTESSYHPSYSHEETLHKIVSGECGAFNPDLLNCLLYIESDMHILLSNKSNEERVNLLEQVYSHNRKYYWAVKRFLDMAVSGAAIVVLSPLMLLICAIIYVDDPKGSPIFKQTRLGRHKKPFTMYKFRTMVVDAEARRAELSEMNEKDGPVFKINDDPRITRVGKFLRKTSLDELPQLFNIWKGDMAIVGPRPPLPEEVAQYSRYQEMRLSVTPGLTCIWQIQDRRDAIGFSHWVDMDVGYIGTRSIRQDMAIICKTVLSMFRKSGS